MDARPHDSAQQIVNLVCQALNSSGYHQLRQLKVYFEHGRITLQGRLPTYYLKQVAQCIVLEVEGVREIDNDVTVFGHRQGVQS